MYARSDCLLSEESRHSVTGLGRSVANLKLTRKLTDDSAMNGRRSFPLRDRGDIFEKIIE
jgi:hypothetical protein